MYRILFAFPGHFKKGGTEAVMFNIFNNIDRDQFHIDFLLTDDEPDHTPETAYLKENGADVYYVCSRSKSLRQQRIQLREFFQKHTYDAVHTHMNTLGADVLQIAKQCGVKTRIAHSHNTSFQLTVRNVKDCLHYAYLVNEMYKLRKYATNQIACSTEAGEWLFGKRLCRQETYYLLRNAIDVSRFAYSPELRQKVRDALGIGDQFVFGHVGRFDHQKNHDLLIDIFHCLHQRNPETMLILIGVGENEANIHQKVEAMGLTQNVLFLGQRSDVNEQLQGFDMFLLPSRYEGLPVIAVEAQTAGLPCVISTNVSPETDISGNVIFVDPGADPAKWADVIMSHLPERDKRISPIDKIRQNGYDMQTNIKELEKYYQKWIERNKAD